MGALFDEGGIRTISVHSSALIARGSRRTRGPETLVLLPVVGTVPTEATPATAAAPILVVDGGVDDALHVGLSTVRCITRRLRFYGVPSVCR